MYGGIRAERKVRRLHHITLEDNTPANWPDFSLLGRKIQLLRRLLTRRVKVFESQSPEDGAL